MRIAHRDGVAAVAVEGKRLLRQALGLPAKNKEAAGAEGRLPVRPLGLGREQEESALVLRGEKCVQVRPMADLYLRPVVQPGPFQMLVVKAEAKGMDKVQDGVCGAAEPGRRAGVGRYFRLDKNDVEGGFRHEINVVEKYSAGSIASEGNFSTKKEADPSVGLPLLWHLESEL